MDDDPRRRADHATVAAPSDDAPRPERGEEAPAHHEPRSERGGDAHSHSASPAEPEHGATTIDASRPRSPTVADPEPGATTVGAALRAVERRLEAAGIEGARFESTLLLGHILGLSRAQLIAALADPLSAEHTQQLHALTTRRAAREPLQYLRGLAPFLDFELEVGPGVFIPRPETEQLVERALELWEPAAGWAVDVGTGSGAIAIGLARGKPDGLVLAIDRNPIALATARRNAERLGVAERIAFVRADLLRAVRNSGVVRDPPYVVREQPKGARQATRRATPGAPRGLGRQAIRPDSSAPETARSRAAAIAVIVSNPPYVATEDEVDPEVRDHEPTEAWVAGPTGLEAYACIIPAAAALLPAGRWLVLELGHSQQRAVGDLFANCGGWDEPTIDPDFRGIPRVLAARRARDSWLLPSACAEGAPRIQ
jgi:release factor glutamine methyltransferase